MTRVFHLETVREGYRDLCVAVRDGDECPSRHGPTRELVGATIVVHDVTRDTMPVGLNRGVNLAIGAIESLNLVGGVSTPARLARVAPMFAQFMDGEVLHGAYGPRIRNQLTAAIDALVDDETTRQAIIQIWDPAYDQPGVRDLPCTLGFQFMVRGSPRALTTITTMRSNDVWWGFAYDIAQFSALHLTVANVLGVTPGPIIHRPGSLHIYEPHWDLVDALELTSYVEVPPLGLEALGAYEAQLRARDLLDGRATPRNATERWYDRVIHENTR